MRPSLSHPYWLPPNFVEIEKMDPFSEASDRDVNDSRWLDAETMALAEGIAESVANGSPLPESAPSSDVTVSTSSAPSIGASQEPSIKFGARVKGTEVATCVLFHQHAFLTLRLALTSLLFSLPHKASYDGTEYSYLVGRTEPAALPQAVLKSTSQLKRTHASTFRQTDALCTASAFLCTEISCFG